MEFLTRVSHPVHSTLSLWRLFWLDSEKRVRVGACIRLVAIVSVMLLRGRFSTQLSAERRRQTQLLVSGTDRAGILRGMARYLGAVLLLSPINKIYLRLLRSLRLMWTQHLTEYFLARLIKTQCQSRGGVVAQELKSAKQKQGGHTRQGSSERVVAGLASALASDVPEGHESAPRANPDQVIAADAAKFVSVSLNLTLDSAQAIIDMLFFVNLLRSLSPTLSKLVVACAAVGTLCTSWLGRHLQKLILHERRADGDFTYALTRMRENAESIAFYEGQEHEVKKANALLTRRHDTERNKLEERDVVALFGEQYRKLVSFLPTVVFAGRGTDGSTDFGLIDQTKEAFEEILSGLLIVSDNFSQFSLLATVANELHAYDEESKAEESLSATGVDALIKLESLDMAALPAPDDNNNSNSAGGALTQSANSSAGVVSWMYVNKLCLRIGNRTLISDLNLIAPARGGLMISGESGVGKTSLLRALAGLWKCGSGTVRRDTKRVLFLPQRPYMSLGTLREQLLYPLLMKGSAAEHGLKVSDEELIDVLKRVDLAHVVARYQGNMDVEARWDEELSLGEQQRMAIARVLVQKPTYAILDEVTSANDSKREALMYADIARTCTAWVSVGHRESIELFHCMRLRLFGDRQGGAWTVEELKHANGSY